VSADDREPGESGAEPTGDSTPARTAATRSGQQWAGSAVVILAGGRSARFGAAEKTAARLGDRSVLDWVLDGVPDRVPLVVAGPRRPSPREGLVWVREEPAGGGPVAGLAAALALLAPGVDCVIVLAGDQPFGMRAAPRLLAALRAAGKAAAVGTDPEGRAQPLLAAYRLDALRSAIGPAPFGRAMRQVLAGLDVVGVPVTHREALDVDTPEDLRRAEALLLSDLEESAP